MDLSRRRFVRAGAAAAAATVAGCLGGGPGDGDATTDGETTDGETTTGSMADGTTTGGTTRSEAAWRTTELTNVLTDETFTVGGFDTPVVLETFAVWCPVCTKQQHGLQSLKESMGDDVAVVSLDIDPNENASEVKAHAEEKGFDWHYAVAPSAVTTSLVEEFGSVVTSPPAAPVMVSCPGGDAWRIQKRGVKSASVIESQVGDC